MFDIAGTVELGTICPGTGTWNRLQDGMDSISERAVLRDCSIVLVMGVSVTAILEF